MVVSLHNEPSTKRRRCLVGEERKLPGTDDDGQDDSGGNQQTPTVAAAHHSTVPAAASSSATATTTTTSSSKPVCTIFIGGLHPRILEAHIEKMCAPYGSIQRLHLCDRKGYAFCQYATAAEAQAAMQALDGRGLLGRRLMVRPAHNDSSHAQHHHSSAAMGHHGNNNNQQNSSNPDKERERLEARIQAVKRKLDARQQSSPSTF